jgi:hypothetical protein
MSAADVAKIQAAVTAALQPFPGYKLLPMGGMVFGTAYVEVTGPESSTALAYAVQQTLKSAGYTAYTSPSSTHPLRLSVRAIGG